MIRVRAGISYALTTAMDEGHCGLPTDELVPLAEKLLEVPQQLIRTALELELQEGTVIAKVRFPQPTNRMPVVRPPTEDDAARSRINPSRTAPAKTVARRQNRPPALERCGSRSSQSKRAKPTLLNYPLECGRV